MRLECFAQDVPINLAALKQRVEELKTNAEVARLQADGARLHKDKSSQHVMSTR